MSNSDRDDRMQPDAVRYPGPAPAGGASAPSSRAGGAPAPSSPAGGASTGGSTVERTPSLPTVLAGCLVLVLAAGAVAVRLSGTLPVHSSPTIVILVVGVALLATGAILALAGRRGAADAAGTADTPGRERDSNGNTPQ